MENNKAYITKKDIYEMGYDNYIIGQFITLHEQKDMDWAVCLAYMVKALADDNKEKQRLLTKYASMVIAPIQYLDK